MNKARENELRIEYAVRRLRYIVPERYLNKHASNNDPLRDAISALEDYIRTDIEREIPLSFEVVERAKFDPREKVKELRAALQPEFYTAQYPNRPALAVVTRQVAPSFEFVIQIEPGDSSSEILATALEHIQKKLGEHGMRYNLKKGKSERKRKSPSRS